jgi:hypothetical protein
MLRITSLRARPSGASLIANLIFSTTSDLTYHHIGSIEVRWFRHAHGNSDGVDVGLGRGGRRSGFSYGVTT